MCLKNYMSMFSLMRWFIWLVVPLFAITSRRLDAFEPVLWQLLIVLGGLGLIGSGLWSIAIRMQVNSLSKKDQKSAKKLFDNPVENLDAKATPAVLSVIVGVAAVVAGLCLLGGSYVLPGIALALVVLLTAPKLRCLSRGVVDVLGVAAIIGVTFLYSGVMLHGEKTGIYEMFIFTVIGASFILPALHSAQLNWKKIGFNGSTVLLGRYGLLILSGALLLVSIITFILGLGTFHWRMLFFVPLGLLIVISAAYNYRMIQNRNDAGMFAAIGFMLFIFILGLAFGVAMEIVSLSS